MKLKDVFAVLKPDLSIDTVEVSPTVYQELDERFDGFEGHVLISTYDFDADWPTWERHPAGDELVLLLSGSARMVLREGDSYTEIELTQPGEYIVVPRNTWHTARVAGPTHMLFVTPGEGTENRADL